MSYIWRSRVKQTTSTTGTGSLSLGSAAAQHRALGSSDNGHVGFFVVESGNGVDWEEFWGVYTHSGAVLTRNLIDSSTGSPISLSGTSTVMLVSPAVYFRDQVLNVKALVAAPTSINLSTDCEAGDTLNGVVLQEGNTIFTPNQSTQADRRIWLVNSSGAPSPHPLMPTGAIIGQYLVTVTEGSLLKDRVYLQTGNTVQIGSGSLTWSIINEVSSDQAALTVLKGPASGADAPPTFGVLTSAYIPAVPYVVRNLVVNSGFWFCSMRKTPGTNTSYSDDTYGMDSWNLLCEGASVQCQQVTGNTAQYAMKLTNNAGSSKRVGTCQILESFDSIPLRSQTVTFRCLIKCSETKNLRLGVVSHVGTADSVTSDIVADWTSTTFSPPTGSNFYQDAGGAADSVFSAQIACTAGTWREATVTGSVAALANNVILGITCDDQISNNATVEIESVVFVVGSEVPSGLTPGPYAIEAWRSRRFFWRMDGQQYQDGYRSSSAQIYANRIAFNVDMRATPTCYVTGSPTYNNGAAGASQVASYDRNVGGYNTISGALTVSALAYSFDRILLYLTAGTNFTNGAVGNEVSLDLGSDFHVWASAAL